MELTVAELLTFFIFIIVIISVFFFAGYFTGYNECNYKLKYRNRK